MKFDKMRKEGRGLSATLRNDSGQAVGMIHSCFVSSKRGAFSRNLEPGYLTAAAGVFDMKTGENVKVVDWSDSTCRLRVDADKAFRKWMRECGIRDKLIRAASEFAAQK